jgi:uncharacterized protein YigE (DUF2233 family)
MMIVKYPFLFSIASLAFIFIAFRYKQLPNNELMVAYVVDAKKQKVDFYWKNDKGETLKSIQNLKEYVESKKRKLLFAMNGGMFKRDFSPQGLLIQNKKRLAVLDTSKGQGNFYLMPNGVFYITDENVPVVCETQSFIDNGKIKYATQSGPMLLINGQIHPAFREGSTNLNIRNGVGILPNGHIIFAMSKKEINFYDFAKYFQNLGCKNALYLDGFVSKMYCPEQNWEQTDGNFGVMIGVSQ